MIARAALLCLAAAPAFAGDSATPGPAEIIMRPYVVEVADLGALLAPDPRFTDADRMALLDQDAPLPAQVPLPAGWLLLAGALLALRAVRS